MSNYKSFRDISAYITLILLSDSTYSTIHSTYRAQHQLASFHSLQFLETFHSLLLPLERIFS